MASLVQSALFVHLMSGDFSLFFVPVSIFPPSFKLSEYFLREHFNSFNDFFTVLLIIFSPVAVGLMLHLIRNYFKFILI